VTGVCQDVHLLVVATCPGLRFRTCGKKSGELVEAAQTTFFLVFAAIVLNAWSMILASGKDGV